MKRTTRLIYAMSIIPASLLVSCSSVHKSESTGQYLDNTVITAKIKTNLLADKQLRSLPITVRTYKNTVQLSGFVNNASQKMRAEQIARRVQGVENVEDSLIIKSK